MAEATKTSMEAAGSAPPLQYGKADSILFQSWLVLFLVVIIIGIPLLVLVPFALLALAVVFLVGFTAVSYYVGQLVSARFGTPHPSPYVTTILGIFVVMSPVLLGRVVGLGDGLVFPITAALLFIGFCFEYVAWTIGFGAVALNRFDRREAQAAPSAPAT